MLTALNTAASMSAISTFSPVATSEESPTSSSSWRRNIKTGMVKIMEVATDTIAAVFNAERTRSRLRAP